MNGSARCRWPSVLALLAASVTSGCTEESAAPNDHDGAGGAGTGGAAAGGAEADPPVTIDAGVISASAASISESEPAVAANDAGEVAVAWIGRASYPFHIGYRISHDGGASWEPLGRLDPPEGFSAGDPTLAADAAGNLLLAWAGIKRDRQGQRVEGKVFLSRAAPGESTFDATVEITDPAAELLYDQPRIVVTPTGRYLCSFMSYPKDQSKTALVVATSGDGQQWQRAVVKESAALMNFAFPCTAQSDRVWLKYIDSSGGVEIAWSDDAGVSWPAGQHARVSLADETFWKVGLVIPGCVTSDEHVWVLYTLASGKHSPNDLDTLTSLELVRSAANGVAFDERWDAGDPAAGAAYMLPELVREPDGAIDLVYYAGAGPGDTAATVRRARSTDGGASFAPTEIIHGPVVLEKSRSSPRWAGDYVGIAWSAGGLHVAYADNAGSAAHIAFWRTNVR